MQEVHAEANREHGHRKARVTLARDNRTDAEQ